jgi:DNA polymerase-4
LRGKPVVVGGTGNRGVVCAASYEARVFGVHSAMPTSRARRLCPHAVFLPTRFDRYAELSGEVMSILQSVTPLVEQLSVDEAFLDVAGVRRRFGTGAEVAAMLRSRVRDETGLTLSVGVATTKFLAKLSSDLSKPDGLLVVEPGTELAFLAPLPVTRLWGVGPATFAKLDRMGLRTVGDLARLPEEVLIAALGDSLGRHLRALARNEDDREVVPDRETKSIGAEETFGTDLTAAAECDRELVRLSERVTIRLRHAGLVARTISLKIRFGDFETRTRAKTLREPTDSSAIVLATARELLEEFDAARGIRLLGVSTSNFGSESLQTSFAFDADPTVDLAHQERYAAAERAADAVRDRFGDRAVRPATLARPIRKRS